LHEPWASSAGRDERGKCLELGLLDEIHIDLVPLLLGKGVRLFEQDTPPTELVVRAASGNPNVTHLT
jgi:dihydrofolate reductase